jgi:16S rRNA (cytosine967-C5)-methyltransferase
VRLGLRAELIAADASHIESWWDHQHFDAIMLDLPCSATGVIRRNPDVRLMRSENSLKSLIGMQTMILDATWETLTVGGRLLVTTCSILPQENQHQIKKFLDRHKDAQLMAITNAPGINTEFGIQHLPTHSGGDGFFYSLLVKSEPNYDGVSA